MTNREKIAIIIGAGPAGLSAAYHSACEGNEVILIERNEKAGTDPSC